MARATARARREGTGPDLPRIQERDIDAVLAMLRPAVEAIGRTVGAHCEVVLHDLRVPERSIVAISNGAVTGRRVGGPVVGGPTKDVALKLLDSAIKESTLSVGYRTQTRDGRELRSTSLVLRTPLGKPVIALCLNLDLSAFTMARLLLEEIAKTPTASNESVGEETQMDVGDVIAQMIQEALADVGKPAKFMDREDRLRAVRLMQEHGLFLIRGGVERAAAALGISKFTLYGYLKEVRAFSSVDSQR
jgi:predicted transcriptional regulator YheO